MLQRFIHLEALEAHMIFSRSKNSLATTSTLGTIPPLTLRSQDYNHFSLKNWQWETSILTACLFPVLSLTKQEQEIFQTISHSTPHPVATRIQQPDSNRSQSSIYLNQRIPIDYHDRKSLDKHSLPLTCDNPGCLNQTFADRGGLRHHEREVHGSQTYNCPISTCKRSTRGFPRKWNFEQHMKKSHPSISSPIPPSQTTPHSPLQHLSTYLLSRTQIAKGIGYISI